MRKLERQLRLTTGLIVGSFVLLHFLNHALGVVSVDAMDSMRSIITRWWWSPLGTLLLYGSLGTHFFLALISLYRRTTLRMPAWEAAQLGLGLLVPPLLIAHVVGTRLAGELLGHQINYVRVISVLWADPSLALRQSLLLLIVWAHFCFGMHYWLRVRVWYPQAQPLLFAAALLVPTLALAGFASAGFTLGALVDRMGGPVRFNIDLANMTPQDHALLRDWGNGLIWGFWLALGATLLARAVRPRMGPRFSVHHASGRVVTAPLGRSILEAVRAAGVPHASVCGGRARCTTCRVRIGRGLEALPPPSTLEAEALGRIAADPSTRLACQTRPTHDVWVRPLVPANADAALARRPGGVEGRERMIAAMFVDLRDSTALGASRLPYDVLFVLNQFFAEMYEALRSTGGHYAQFRGDGLLALYGLHSDIASACRRALAGAIEMQHRLERLNRSLASELVTPLRIGIGLHAGEAIVGTMGPPDAPIYSAVGDNVNIAARFEGLCKHYGCVMVVSAAAIRHAGIALPDAPLHRLRVRGRAERIEAYAIDDPARALLLETDAVAVGRG